MRYRPFGVAAQSISAISLHLRAGMEAAQAQQLAFTALECGVNGFSAPAGDDAAASALRDVVGAAGRGVLVLMLRLELDATGFERQVDAALRATGAGHLDVVAIERPPIGALTPEDFAVLDRLRTARVVRRLGLIAEDAEADHYLAATGFDILETRYTMRSDWQERNRIKSAAAHGMVILGYGFDFYAAVKPTVDAAPRGMARFLRRPEPRRQEAAAVAHAYDFLHRTRGWSAKQITLVHALGEPTLASVMVETDDTAELEGLAEATEREMPNGMAALVEIARATDLPKQNTA